MIRSLKIGHSCFGIALVLLMTACGSGAGGKKLQGGTHTWYLNQMNDPAHTPFDPNLEAMTGTVTNDIVWNFFAAHPKP